MADFLGVVIVLGIIVFGVVRSIVSEMEKADKRREMKKLKRTNPKVYAQLKQIKHEKQLMEHDRQRMQHETRNAGANIVGEIFRWWLQ